MTINIFASSYVKGARAAKIRREPNIRSSREILLDKDHLRGHNAYSTARFKIILLHMVNFLG